MLKLSLAMGAVFALTFTTSAQDHKATLIELPSGTLPRDISSNSMVVGELQPGLSDRATAIEAAFKGAGIEARASATMDVELWQKFVFITAMAAVCGLGRASIGPVRDAPGGHRLIQRAVGEVVAIARLRGIPLPQDEAPRTCASRGRRSRSLSS